MPGTPGARHLLGAPILCKRAAGVATLGLSSVCFIFTTRHLIAESWVRPVSDLPCPLSLLVAPWKGITETGICHTLYLMGSSQP